MTKRGRRAVAVITETLMLKPLAVPYPSQSRSRRRSLLPLAGAVAIAAIARTSPVHAGTDARKAKKRSRKKCKRQVDRCRASLTRLCADTGCDDGLLAESLTCCQHLSRCKARAALVCFLSRVN